MIELNQVSKMYGNVVGVNDLTLSIPKGAYGLIGPNGSGKTTLINLLIGQFRPTLGRLTVLDCDPAGNRRLLKRIGLCPASDVLYPNVSAIEWVTYQVRLHGIPRRDCQTLAEAALETVGMTSAMRRPMGTYSLGMRQRTKIAQAIAHDPELLILDEPYNGLDPVGRNDMTQLLKEWTGKGRGLIFASHVLQEIESVTASFLLIHGGRLLASGTADEIELLLADAPQQISLVGKDVSRLIHRLADVDWVDAMDWNHGKDELRVSVREPLEFYDRIAKWIHDDGLVITQLRTPNGNLEAVFESLLRRHRGELS
ncbi:ABC transporter ATP-binding protein [Rubripirellula amarantea]|nr:ABC transporter ATP-binding protein [Rubripirellula amarantea]